MELNKEQKDAVAQWFAAGTGLDEIQKRIASEFGVRMSYLDLRLMVADLPQPQEKTPPPSESAPEIPEAAEYPESPELQDDPGIPGDAETPAAEDPAAPDAGGGAVSVDIDALTIPGTIASGTVSFSDGKSGKWYLDRMGRLGLADLPAEYRPSEQDAADFQSKLVALLRSKGLM